MEVLGHGARERWSGGSPGFKRHRRAEAMADTVVMLAVTKMLSGFY